MKHPNKRMQPSSLTTRYNPGKLIKIKASSGTTSNDAISCIGATTSAGFTVASELGQPAKIYHAIEVNGIVHNADNQQDIVGNLFNGGDVAVTLINHQDGQVRITVIRRLGVSGYPGGIPAKIKLIPPASPDIANNITGITDTDYEGGPNNPTIKIDEETKVVTVCVLTEVVDNDY